MEILKIIIISIILIAFIVGAMALKIFLSKKKNKSIDSCAKPEIKEEGLSCGYCSLNELCNVKDEEGK